MGKADRVFINQFSSALDGGLLPKTVIPQRPQEALKGSGWMLLGGLPRNGGTEGVWAVGVGRHQQCAPVTIYVFRNILFMKSTYERSNVYFWQALSPPIISFQTFPFSPTLNLRKHKLPQCGFKNITTAAQWSEVTCNGDRKYFALGWSYLSLVC